MIILPRFIASVFRRIIDLIRENKKCKYCSRKIKNHDYEQLRFCLSQSHKNSYCFNCSKNKPKRLKMCEQCYIKYREMFPKNWSNVK